MISKILGQAPATTSSGLTICLSAGSALLVAILNIVFTGKRERRAFRQQKLEELHRAVFFMTWGVHSSLHGLQREFGRRDALLTTKDGYLVAKRNQNDHESIRMPVDKAGFSQEKLDRCCESIRQLRADFPKEKMLNDLEPFIRLSTVQFSVIADERNAVADYARAVVIIHGFLPEDKTTTHLGNETITAQRLAWEAEQIRLRVLPRICALANPRPFPFSLFGKSKSASTWAGPTTASKTSANPPSGEVAPPNAHGIHG